MKSVSLLLGLSVLLLPGRTVSTVSLSVSPDLQQFFSKDSVSLSCVEGGQTGGQIMKRTAGGQTGGQIMKRTAEGQTGGQILKRTAGGQTGGQIRKRTAGGQTGGQIMKRTAEGQTGGQIMKRTAGGQTGGQIMKRTAGGQTGGCGQNFGTMSSSSCSFPHLSPSDSGVYWCETSDGQKSQQVNISVRDDRVILQIPALPVQTGSDVTLHCRSKNRDFERAYFFRDDVHFSWELEDAWTIRDVSRTDEGKYYCSTETYKSADSWLRVAAPPSPPSSVFRLFCLLVVVCLFCICSVILMSRCCRRKTENKSAVSMEMTPCVEEYDYIPADVITHHDV